LPFVVSTEGVIFPRLSVEQYPWLQVEPATWSDRRVEIGPRYQVPDEKAWRALDEHWKRSRCRGALAKSASACASTPIPKVSEPVSSPRAPRCRRSRHRITVSSTGGRHPQNWRRHPPRRPKARKARGRRLARALPAGGHESRSFPSRHAPSRSPGTYPRSDPHARV
jgi:hypothetical protein